MARASKFKFTDDLIEKLPVPRRRAEYADTMCQGLRLRVGTSGVRSFLFYERDEKGRRRGEILGRWSRTGVGGTLTVAAARTRFLDRRGQRKGLGRVDVDGGRVARLLRRAGQALQVHRDHPAEAPEARRAPRRGYARARRPAQPRRQGPGRLHGRRGQEGRWPRGRRQVPGVAGEHVRAGAGAGRFPPDTQLPTLGLAREDFADIGWKARERVPSERELHQLFDALGIGTGERIEIDLKKSPRVSLATRLAVLLLLHVPVRSGAGILSQRAAAVDRKAKVLRWRTRKGPARRGPGDAALIGRARRAQ